jgi:hypothetical protein
MPEKESVNIEDVKEVLDLISKLNQREKELALAALKGMTLMSECGVKAV